MLKGSKAAIPATAKQKDKQQGDKQCVVKKNINDDECKSRGDECKNCEEQIIFHTDKWISPNVDKKETRFEIRQQVASLQA
jgi:hypothetical protein